MAEILSRGKNDHISRKVEANPNTPPEAKIKWMRETGKIEVEDPSRHIIEEVPEEKDEDFSIPVEDFEYKLKEGEERPSEERPRFGEKQQRERRRFSRRREMR